MSQLATHERLSAKSTLLEHVFAVLDDAKIPYVVLHGYEGYPASVTSDVDCLMPARVLPHRLAAVLHENRERIGGEVVNWLDGAAHFVTIAGRDDAGTPVFLHFHIVTSLEVARRPLLAGETVLQRRARHGGFWIPAARHEFLEQLSRRVEKSKLTESHAQRLRELYQQDEEGCRQAILALFGIRGADVIMGCVRSGNWREVSLRSLRKRMLIRRTWKHPIRTAWNVLTGAARVASRRLKADRGLNIVLLGPDGSGKSTVVAAARQDLAGAFIATERRTFPPALRQRAVGETSSTPHAVVPRSWIASTARALGYWFVYYTAGYPFTVGKALADAKLVVHDRHLLDCLVDPRRYRYGGPMPLLRLICRLIVKPDMVILLDAPAEVIQSRKSEVPLEETRRQRRVYCDVVSTMPRSYIVNGDRPLTDVTAEVNELILRHMAAHSARKLRPGGGE
jgi:thymidylate kinase